MRFTFEKSLRIVNDLLRYWHEFGGENYTVDVKCDEEGTRYQIQIAVEGISQEHLEELKNIFSIPRQREIEQMYWNVSAESDAHINLELIAMMLDCLELTYDGQLLTMEAMRKKD